MIVRCSKKMLRNFGYDPTAPSFPESLQRLPDEARCLQPGAPGRGALSVNDPSLTRELRGDGESLCFFGFVIFCFCLLLSRACFPPGWMAPWSWRAAGVNRKCVCAARRARRPTAARRPLRPRDDRVPPLAHEGRHRAAPRQVGHAVHCAAAQAARRDARPERAAAAAIGRVVRVVLVVVAPLVDALGELIELELVVIPRARRRVRGGRAGALVVVVSVVRGSGARTHLCTHLCPASSTSERESARGLHGMYPPRAPPRASSARCR